MSKMHIKIDENGSIQQSARGANIVLPDNDTSWKTLDDQDPLFLMVLNFPTQAKVIFCEKTNCLKRKIEATLVCSKAKIRADGVDRSSISVTTDRKYAKPIVLQVNHKEVELVDGESVDIMSTNPKTFNVSIKNSDLFVTNRIIIIAGG